MRRKDPFKHHRFPREVILSAVRLYLRYPLSYCDVRDLLAERGVEVDRATIYRWVLKFGLEIAKRSFAHRNSKGLDWQVMRPISLRSSSEAVAYSTRQWRVVLSVARR